MESGEKKHDYTIDFKLYKKNWGLEKITEFNKKLKSLNLVSSKNKSDVFFIVKIPISFIFYVEYFDKKITYHFRSSELTLVDDRNIALVEILQKINQNLNKSDIWSNFIKIKSYYLVRRSDVKGYDNNEKKVLLSSVSHIKKTAKISVSRDYKRELFKDIRFISKGILFIKSIQNIEYIIYPQDIKYVISHSNSKKVILKNNLFTKFIEVKRSKSSNRIKNFFNDEYNILFRHGMFIKLNRNIIFNLEIFDEDIFKDVIYKDLFCNNIKMEFHKNTIWRL
jgi:hypothetical protein